ncbi:hypothetical protein KY289_005379 [Solanum tuberosum]|nr:hypothetical protein KY289_005379 [Solanum tuberosum]
MAPENQPTTGPPTFTEENYHIWPIKMKAYLKALNLWEVVELGEHVVQPLRVYATLNDIKTYDELVTRSIHDLSPAYIQAWDKLKEEFKGSKGGMKDSDGVKEYSSKLMEIVNQIRKLAIEESYDLTTLTIAKLISKLQVQEKRVIMKNEGIIEDAFQARDEFKHQKESRKVWLDKSGGNQGDLSIKGKFPPCGICKKTNHLEKNC